MERVQLKTLKPGDSFSFMRNGPLIFTVIQQSLSCAGIRKGYVPYVCNNMLSTRTEKTWVYVLTLPTSSDKL